MEPSQHYRGQRETLSALISGLSEEQLGAPVPACPLWRVNDLVAHLAGLPADVNAGRTDGLATPAWTKAQVQARRERSVDELLAEWAAEAETFEPALEGMGFRGWVFVYEVTIHGDDLREALDVPLGDSETHAVVVDGLITQARSKADGPGALTLLAGDRSWVVGEGDPQATLRAPDERELGRVLAGRRSHDAVRALDWTGDPTPWLPVLPLFPHGS